MGDDIKFRHCKICDNRFGVKLDKYTKSMRSFFF